MLSRASVVVILSCFSPVAASASSISVYFSTDGTMRCAPVVPNAPVTWYILAVLGGDAAAGGITGAELRQTGTPEGWAMVATPAPAATLVMGDPLADGAQIAFSACQLGGPGLVLLYTVSGMAPSSVPCTPLSVWSHRNPSNPTFSCPLLVLCDAPVYTKICATGGDAWINGVCGHPAGCPTALQSSTWPRVKRLFD